jgi:hypothetical protein
LRHDPAKFQEKMGFRIDSGSKKLKVKIEMDIDLNMNGCDDISEELLRDPKLTFTSNGLGSHKYNNLINSKTRAF